MKTAMESVEVAGGFDSSTAFGEGSHIEWQIEFFSFYGANDIRNGESMSRSLKIENRAEAECRQFEVVEIGRAHV